MNTTTDAGVLGDRLVRRELSDGRTVELVETTVEVAAFDPEKRTVEVLASDATLDRYGDRIEVEGWQLEQYANNPVVQINHSYAVQDNVGTATVRKTPQGLRASITLNADDPAAEMVSTKLRNRSVRAVSVGFLPREWELIRDEQGKATGGIRFVKSELLEISFVAVPANANALVISNSLDPERETEMNLTELETRLIEQGEWLKKIEDDLARKSAHAAAATAPVQLGNGHYLLRREHRMLDLPGIDRSRFEDLGPNPAGEVIRGLITGKWASPELRAAGEGNSTAGGFLLGLPVSSYFIDLARNKARLFEAGAFTIPMEDARLRVARITTDPSPEWKAENASGTEASIVFGAWDLRARTLFCYVKCSNELLADAPNAASLIESTLAAAIAVELDRVGLVGAGGGEEPVGLQYTSGVGTETSVASPVYADFVNAQTDVRTANGEPNAIILHPRDLGTLNKLTGAVEGQPMQMPPCLVGLPWLHTSQIPTTLGAGANESVAFVGDFKQMGFGIRRTVEILASPHGDALAANQTWVRAIVRADVLVARPSHFSVLSGITA